MSGNRPGESNAALVAIPSIVFCGVSPIVVGIRFWSRMTVKHSLGWDDWTILGSLVFSMAVSVLLLAACDFGFGKHIKDLTPHNKMMSLKVFYKVNINMTKASILLLYLRIFVQKTFRVICMVMLGIIICYGVASSAASIFQCTPIPRAWNRAIPGHCIDITKNWYANAGFSIATDTIILTLPMPLLYALKLPRNQKIALMGVFALGGFVVVTSILRMTTLNLSTKTPDTTYQLESSMWTIIEENIGIICACLPMFRPLLSKIFPRIFPNRNGSSFGASAKLSTGNSSHGGWHFSSAPNSRNIQLTTIVMTNNNDSVDRIMPHNTPGSPTLSDQTTADSKHVNARYNRRDSDVSNLS